MSDLRTAAQQALEAMEDHANQYPHMQKGYTVDAINALRDALNEPRLTLNGMTPTEFALNELYEFQQATGCDTAEKFKSQQKPELQDIEQYRMQMAAISTAAIGYWKESDGIHPDYDTLALRDVASLYTKYDTLYKAQRRKPLTDEYIDTLSRSMVKGDKSVNWLCRTIERAHGIEDKQ